MARTSSLGGFIKQLDREQATPQARTGVYCLINMMLDKIVLFPKLDSPKVGQRRVLSGQQTKNQCFQSLSPRLPVGGRVRPPVPGLGSCTGSLKKLRGFGAREGGISMKRLC